jgi:1-pyrroline-5-carboxylate dehydrogenase
MLPPFQNEPCTDFFKPENIEAYEAALKQRRRELGYHYPLIIHDRKYEQSKRIASINPARPAELVGTVAAADVTRAEQALAAAWRAFPAWSETPAEMRAAKVLELARKFRRQKFDLAALETLEASKNWLEADADVAEAIDFCEYYARQAMDIAQPRPTYPYPGESNQSWLQPLGAGLVISPWNFPLAIVAGMALGPVAAGNTVVVKPSSYTPIVAAAFMAAVEAVGFPPGVINFLPGSGEVIGNYLVAHAQTRFINFTGSKEVGLWINSMAAQVQPEQKWLKRVYPEMGGKGAIIIDETADFDAALTGVISSAFGFQGQKCSAASRLIIIQEVYKPFLERLLEAIRALTIGPAETNHQINAIISKTQYTMILAEIAKGRQEAKLLLGGQPLDLDGGYYISPAVFGLVPPAARLAQHEIFGPVLAVMSAENFDKAVKIFNATEYGLTGGLYSRDPKRLQRARRELYVGNLYLNRKITGARVGVQPFGGFKISGVNAKAGGPDYLRLFVEMKTVSEKQL